MVVLSAVANYWSKVCSVLLFSMWSHAEAKKNSQNNDSGKSRESFALSLENSIVLLEAGQSRVTEGNSKTEFKSSWILIF